jgi:hypothetical protein
MISQFFDFKYDMNKIKESIELFSFENMKKREIEKDNSLNNTQAFEKLLNRTIINEPDSFKVRRGKVGGYVDYISEDDINYVDSMLKQYDYYEKMK